MAEEPQELTQEEELMQLAQTASKVQTTLNTPGWTEVIKPALEGRRQFFLTGLLSRQKSMEDVAFAQQSVLAIDELFAFIKAFLDEGEGAKEYFSAKQGKKQE